MNIRNASRYLPGQRVDSANQRVLCVGEHVVEKRQRRGLCPFLPVHHGKPCCISMYARMKWVLMIPDTLIHPRAICSTTNA